MMFGFGGVGLGNGLTIEKSFSLEIHPWSGSMVFLLQGGVLLKSKSFEQCVFFSCSWVY